MGARAIVQAGETGLASVVEGVAKVHEALPENVREVADRKLGVESTFGKGVMAMVDTVAEESAKARVAKEAALAEVAAVREMEADELEEKVLALSDAAEQRARSSRVPGRRIAVGVVLLGAAAGGAYFVWRRRRATAEEQLSGESAWGATPTDDDAPGTSMLDADLAEEVDEAADELAATIVDSIEVDEVDLPADVTEAPEPAAASSGSADEATAPTDEEHKPES